MLLTVTLAIGLVVGPAGSSAEACNVPVFRYALEHWRPDPYRGVLFHRGPLSADEQERLEKLQARAWESEFNLTIRTVDLDASPDPADQELLPAADDPDLPRLVIQYPAHLRVDKPVWIGPLGDTELAALLDSPLRREVLKRLTSGQTAVWLMVDSGDAGQDDAAAATLEKELKGLQATLKLPELTDSPEDVIQDGPPLRVEFSLLRVRRDDPAEQTLVAMLTGCEEDLAGLNEPLVFPLFGRSRAMLPLVGGGISPDNIRGSAKFLSGACSCQVKELNPGFDLLITADWNALLSWAKSPAFASGESLTAEPELVPIPSGSKAASTDASSSQRADAATPADAHANEADRASPAPVTTESEVPAPTGGVSSKMLVIGGMVLVLLMGVIFFGRGRA